MSKYVALQDILHNGRMHRPGEVIDCPDPKLAAKWIENRAVEAVGPMPREADQRLESVPNEVPCAPEVPEAILPQAEQPRSDDPPKLGRTGVSGARK